jgi:multiple antibiotic resistance protein
MVERIVTDAVAFFVVVNPIGLVPLFIAVTRQETPRHRRAIALRAVTVAALILIAFIAGGQLLLDALGIGVPSFRIAGGLVLLVISLRMILEEVPAGAHAPAFEQDTTGPKQDVAVFPLAMPFIAGPGTIMAAVVLTDNTKFSLPEQATTVGVLLAILAVTFGMLLMADPIRRVLKEAGTNVVGRVLGLVLAALSVQIILEGIRATFSLR